MSDFVGKDTRNFGFPVGGLDDSPIEIDEAPGQGERVDARIVDEGELIGVSLKWRDCCKLLSEAVDVFAQQCVIDEGEFLFGFGGDLAPHRDLIVD